MKIKTAPTSPKYPLENDQALDKVWREPNIQPPARIPLVSLALWSLVFSLIGLVVVIGGVTWYLRQNPNSRLKNFLPATVTTIIENSSNNSGAELPNDVRQFADTIVSLVTTPGSGSVAVDNQISGTAAALSSTGWLVTLNNALPAKTPISVIDSQRTIQNVDQTVYDPAAPFVFLKAATGTYQAADFVSANKIKSGESVWVIVRRLTANVGIRRQLLPASQTWQGCDQLVAPWVLDEPVTAPLAAPIVTDDGRLLGLLGANQAVWPVSMVESVLKNLFDQQTITRPSCGFSYLSGQAAAAVTPLTGLLIGAAPGKTAIEPKGPAANAGLQSGDVITDIDGTTVTDWLSVISSAHPGQKLKMTIKRGATEKIITLTLGLLKS